MKMMSGKVCLVGYFLVRLVVIFSLLWLGILIFRNSIFGSRVSVCFSVLLLLVVRCGVGRFG